MTPERLAEALQRHLPELRIGPLAVIDVGFGSVVVETAGGAVFRVARHARAAAGHAREIDVLPKLRDALPVAIPDIRWRIGASPDLPFGAVGYPKLPGRPAAPADAGDALANDVARFLRALHESGADVPPVPDDRAELRAATRPALRDRLPAREFDALERWWDDLLADDSLQNFPQVPRHGDLWYENLLVDDSGALAAVVDWEAAGLGDAAEDFAALRHLGGRFTAGVLAAYGPADPGLAARIERRWQLRELFGVRTAVELGDESELADAVAKLRRGPVLGRPAE